jgi:hypothetical protein
MVMAGLCIVQQLQAGMCATHPPSRVCAGPRGARRAGAAGHAAAPAGGPYDTTRTRVPTSHIHPRAHTRTRLHAGHTSSTRRHDWACGLRRASLAPRASAHAPHVCELAAACTPCQTHAAPATHVPVCTCVRVPPGRQVREGRLLRQLGGALAAANAAAAAAGGGPAAVSGQEATFEAWMKRESDLVQVRREGFCCVVGCAALR